MLLSRIGPIALEEPLGGSADSNVLRGVHVERNKAMAVKLLPRQLVDRPMGGDTFGEDVKRLQKLVHPNIVRVLGGAMENGQPYIAMDFVKGESLRSLFDRRGRLPWETMADVAEAICEALDYAHGQGVVHRRLTPARVMIGDDGNVKLIGFDCALGDGSEVVGLKAPMSVMHYLAPQEIRGKRSVGLPSNDLFSLGVILYEGLTGELPWHADAPAQLVFARQAGPAPRVSATVLECPVWLDVLVARLLEVKREGRLPSADAARRAILDAKSKVASGMGAAQHALSGRQGALARGVNKQDLSRLRKAAMASAPKDTSPFYERAWFLALCLAAVFAVGAWSLWPKSEAALYAHAKPLMDSELVTEWRRAQDDVEELLARFPDTAHRKEIEEFQFQYAVHSAQERIKNIDRFGADPQSEADRQYYAARRDEQLGDRLAAWSKFEALAKQFAGSKNIEERAVAELARRRVAEIRTEASQEQDAEQLQTVVQGKLDQAAALVRQKKSERARVVLERIIEVYDANPEVAPLVDEARQRLKEFQAPAATDEGP